MEPKRLYRSVTDRKVAGVAGGLAEYFVMDPLLIRLAFVILTLAGGGGVLLYIILWIVTPENPMRIEPLRKEEDPSPSSSSSAEQNNSSNWTRQNNGSDPAPGMQPPQKQPPVKGSLIGGLVLITLGGLFLADELLPWFSFGDLWPVILIVIGIGLLINVYMKQYRNTNPN